MSIYISYPGTKSIDGVLSKIINNIPLCSFFIEGFAGSGAVGLNLSVPPGKLVFNDLSAAGTYDICCRLPNAHFSNMNIIDFISTVPDLYPDSLLFLDPPYLYSTRPNSLGLYDFEMSDSDHLLFLDTVLQYSGKVMITHPVCDLYDNKLSDWRKVDYSVRYHKKTSYERIYMNYDVPDQLLDYGHLGVDCWDRQRIKRKSDNFIKKLNCMPIQERNLVLSKISSFF